MSIACYLQFAYLTHPRSEYHLENDISIAQYQYYAATQNKTWLQAKGWPILSKIAEFWADQVVFDSATMKYDTLNESELVSYLTMKILTNRAIFPADPDEFANFKNNAAYTNAGISVVLKNAIQLAAKLGITAPQNWSMISNKITVLSDNSSGIVLEYGESNNVTALITRSLRAADGFNGTTAVKQADVVVRSCVLRPVPCGLTSSLVAHVSIGVQPNTNARSTRS